MSSVAHATKTSNCWSHSRLSATVITLVVVAVILAIMFMVLQNTGVKRSANAGLSIEAKAQYVGEMQSAIASQPPLPQAEKAALVQAMTARLQK